MNGHSNGATNGHVQKDMNGHTNGTNHAPPLWDPDFTARVIAATGSKANPRLAEIMPPLLRHLHDFAREVNLTVDEWMAGVTLINEAGQMSTDRRNETQLLCDILGLESLVDEITSKHLAQNHISHDDPLRDSLPSTSSAILGPFHRPSAPILPPGSSIVSPSLLALDPAYAASLTHLTGRVLTPSGAPLPSALLDIWHAAPNGTYEQQDPSQPDMHLRGRFATDASGRFSLRCLRPPAYPIPDDGPAGRLLKMLDRHPYRPAHIHFIVSSPGYRTLTTQIFDVDDEYLCDDAVFAVKRDLVAEFRPARRDAEGARWEVEFDFVLSPS